MKLGPGPGLSACPPGAASARRPLRTHSHVVEAEQVVAREGPERGHRAGVAAEAGSPRSQSRPAGSRSVSGHCGRGGTLFPGHELLGNHDSDASPSDGQSRDCKTTPVTSGTFPSELPNPSAGETGERRPCDRARRKRIAAGR